MSAAQEPTCETESPQVRAWKIGDEAATVLPRWRRPEYKSGDWWVDGMTAAAGRVLSLDAETIALVLDKDKIVFRPHHLVFREWVDALEFAAKEDAHDHLDC